MLVRLVPALLAIDPTLTLFAVDIDVCGKIIKIIKEKEKRDLFFLFFRSLKGPWNQAWIDAVGQQIHATSFHGGYASSGLYTRPNFPIVVVNVVVVGCWLLFLFSFVVSVKSSSRLLHF